MIKIKYFILGFISLLCFSSCGNEDQNIFEKTEPDIYDTFEFYSIKYDFSKKEINEILSSEFIERFENNTDQVIPMTFYPYIDQGTVEFNIVEMETILDGLECEVPVPKYEYDIWSETQTDILKTVFGEINSFSPLNGNISFTINFDPWKKTKYRYTLTFSELTVPFDAIFKRNNYGLEYVYTGILTIRTPINCDIIIEDFET